jgi:hypothetical protein
MAEVVEALGFGLCISYHSTFISIIYFHPGKRIGVLFFFFLERGLSNLIVQSVSQNLNQNQKK